MINLQQIVYLLKTRKERLSNYNSTYGSKIKEYRIENNLTLEDVAEDVCSVSYLSKIENNLIKPSERFLSLFEEKHKIVKEQNPTLETKILSKIYDAIIDDDQIYLKNVEYPKTNNDYRKKLITLFKSAIELNEKYFKYYISECMLYIQSYTNEEVAILIYALIIYFFNNNQYLKVYEMNNLINEIKNNKIKLRLKYYNFVSSWYLGFGVDEKEVLDVKTFFIHQHDISKVINLAKSEYYKKIYTMKIGKLEKDMKKNNLNQDDKNYFLSIVNFREGNYLEALNLSNKIKTISEEVIVLKSILMYKTKQYEKIDFDFSKLSSEIIIDFIENSFLKKKDFVTFIKNYINVIINKVEKFYLLEFLMLECVDILRSESFYKDALNILIKYNYILRDRIIKN